MFVSQKVGENPQKTSVGVGGGCIGYAIKLAIHFCPSLNSVCITLFFLDGL